MRVGKFEFRPSLVVTLAAIILLIILLSLGSWQLSRGQQKIATQAELEKNYALPEQLIDDKKFFNQNRRFQHARITGRFDNTRQYLLDNRVHKGRPGFIVVTPFIYGQTGDVILVERGWLPLGQNREDLPAIDVSDAEVELHGILSEPYGKLPAFGITPVTGVEKWPRIIRDIEIDQISAQLGYTIPPYLLHLDAQHKAAYTQEWQPVAEGPDKNYSYAIQWYSMALVLVILYFGLNSRPVARKD